MAENLILFTHAKHVGFNLKDVILNTNNEVALLYPKHSNKEVFLCVSDFISKCCIREAFTRSLIQYKEYLSEFWCSTKALDNSKVSFSIPTGGIYEELGVNTFRKAIRAHYSSHSSNYVDPPSINIEDIINKLKKKNREKVVPYTRFLSLLMMQKMKDGYGDAHMVAICNAEKPVAFKAPRSSSQTNKKVSQGTKPGAKAGHKKQSTSSKQPLMSSSEATKAAGGLTSLGVTSEEEAHPQLSSGTDANVLADKTKPVSDGLETVLTTPETGTSNAAKPCIFE
ncbi:hypothetical protein Tco_1467249 [Tanacetum coccineum]